MITEFKTKATPITEFHDTHGQRLHDKFQDWRRKHQDGYFLSFSRNNIAQLHSVLCWHVGGVGFDGYEVRGDKERFVSITKNRKVCSENPEELLLWAVKEGVTVKQCSHCLKDKPFFAFASTQQAAQHSRAAQETFLPMPDGCRTPIFLPSEGTQPQRDDAVKKWVLQQAKGMCECCGEPSPFNGVDGLPYLEVHHIRQLADNGSDTPSNAVALCPNCHRELHYGEHATALVNQLYARVPRLVHE